MLGSMPCFAELVPEGQCRVLRAVIGVVHEPGGGTPPGDGHVERVLHEFGAHVWLHAPAHDCGCSASMITAR